MTGLSLILLGAFIVMKFLFDIWRRYGGPAATEEWLRDHSLEDYLRVGWMLRTTVAMLLFGFFMLLVRRS